MKAPATGGATLPPSVHDRTAAFLVPVKRVRLPITTPEGVQLDVEVATYGERAAAFLIDFAIILGTILALVVAVGLVAGFAFNEQLRGNARLVFALTGLLAFLIRTLYFVRFELAWQGATPGKRSVGLRVIDRHGGPLHAGPIITRNITREIEVFLPLLAFLTSTARGWGGLGLALWTALLACTPLFTRARLRAGDMLAGTMVIAMPKRSLLPDIVAAKPPGMVAAEPPGMVVAEPPGMVVADTAVAERDYVFSERQLLAYGAFELQVLEEILRRPPGVATDALQADVCGRICKRIGWGEAVPAADTDRFLRQFYAAERANLEREQLFGRGREAKSP